MVTRIDVARTLNFDLDDGYGVEIVLVPYGLPDDHPLCERHDDRAIVVPASAGSLWMTLRMAGEQHVIGRATFAADATAVRCDNIEIASWCRRRRLASRLYELASSPAGEPIVPGALLTADAIAFWRARLATKIEAGLC